MAYGTENHFFNPKKYYLYPPLPWFLYDLDVCMAPQNSYLVDAQQVPQSELNLHLKAQIMDHYYHHLLR